MWHAVSCSRLHFECVPEALTPPSIPIPRCVSDLRPALACALLAWTSAVRFKCQTAIAIAEKTLLRWNALEALSLSLSLSLCVCLSLSGYTYRQIHTRVVVGLLTGVGRNIHC
jgi:hypothetical protein